MHSNNLVSVCLITYNHAPYITQALEGILAQKTDFAFEIVIGDDGSTDGTTEICREYAKRFPKQIRYFCRSRAEVVIIDGYPTARNNFLKTFRDCGGEYIAYCEGDDYWQDENKLQKQVNFLQANEEYGMVHAVADVYYQSKDRMKKYKGGHNPPEGEVYNSLFYRMNIFSSSVCARSCLVNKGLAEIEQHGSRWLSGDIALWLTIAFHSKVHYMDEPMIVYRIIKGSASHQDKVMRIIRFRMSLFRIYLHFLLKYGGNITVPWLVWQYLRSSLVEVIKALEQACIRNLRCLFRIKQSA